jgi:hypothetical protein
VLDRALLQVIQHLIARRHGTGVREFLKIAHVEVADSPGKDFAVALQLLEGADGFLERVAAAPMQQITVKTIGLEVLQRFFAGIERAAVRGVAGEHLGNQKYFIAPTGDCLGDHRLGGAAAIHFRRVDVRKTEVHPQAQRRDRV